MSFHVMKLDELSALINSLPRNWKGDSWPEWLPVEIYCSEELDKYIFENGHIHEFWGEECPSLQNETDYPDCLRNTLGQIIKAHYKNPSIREMWQYISYTDPLSEWTEEPRENPTHHEFLSFIAFANENSRDDSTPQNFTEALDHLAKAKHHLKAFRNSTGYSASISGIEILSILQQLIPLGIDNPLDIELTPTSYDLHKEHILIEALLERIISNTEYSRKHNSRVHSRKSSYSKKAKEFWINLRDEFYWNGVNANATVIASLTDAFILSDKSTLPEDVERYLKKRPIPFE